MIDIKDFSIKKIHVDMCKERDFEVVYKINGISFTTYSFKALKSKRK